MTMHHVSVEPRTVEPFRHEAFFYASQDEFLAGTLSFLRAGMAAGDPALVVLAAPKLELLGQELDGEDGSELVLFADMAEVGANPARIIPAWRDFVATSSAPGRALRGIGEPIWAERSADELGECQRHESLLNLAFDGVPGFGLMCPYDTARLPDAVLAEARDSHPFVSDAARRSSSDSYRGLGEIAAPFTLPLPEPRGRPETVAFALHSLAAVRRAVARQADDAGLETEKVHDLVLAVNEVATNSIRHGAGEGVLRIWRDDATLICEVSDPGRMDAPMAGRQRPLPTAPGGYGLWVANQLCDLVQVRSFPTGTVVRLHTKLSG